MNANRRADLQRKLAVAPVEKPPAGLAARIKNEIPKELRFNAEMERKRLAQSVRLSLAVAASVIVVIGTAYLALQMTSRRDEQSRRTAAAVPVQSIARPQIVAQAPPPAANEVAQQQTPEVTKEASTRHLKKKQAAPVVLDAAKPAAVGAAGSESSASKDAFALEEKREREQHAVAQPMAAAPAPTRAAVAERINVEAAANAAKTARDESLPERQMTVSPVSGKLLLRDGKNVYDAPEKPDMAVTPWKETARDTKIAILKEELARGAEPGEVARVAREAGLNEFAESIERKQH